MDVEIPKEFHKLKFMKTHKGVLSFILNFEFLISNFTFYILNSPS